MAKTNRTCYFCGRGYYYCPTCHDKRDPKIYGMFDSEICYEAFNILRDEFLHKVSTDEAKEKLINLGVSERMIVPGKDITHLYNVLNHTSPIPNEEKKITLESKEETIELEPVIIEKDIPVEIKEEVFDIEKVEEKIEEIESIEKPVEPLILGPETTKRQKRRNKNSEVI